MKFLIKKFLLTEKMLLRQNMPLTEKTIRQFWCFWHGIRLINGRYILLYQFHIQYATDRREPQASDFCSTTSQHVMTPQHTSSATVKDVCSQILTTYPRQYEDCQINKPRQTAAQRGRGGGGGRAQSRWLHNAITHANAPPNTREPCV